MRTSGRPDQPQHQPPRPRASRAFVLLATLAAGALLLSACSPKLTWDAPEPVVQWTQLSKVQLDATSPTPGRYFYDPGLGAELSAGTHSIKLTMVPDDPEHPNLQPARGARPITVTAPPRATGGLGSRADLGFVAGATGAAVGDLDNDGLPDLVVVAWPETAVWMGTGPGTFGAYTLYDGPPSEPSSAALADVNGDGNLDVVVADQLNAAFGVLLGTGTGALEHMVEYPTAGGAEVVKVADLNNDGIPDLVAVGSGGHRVSVVLGKGDGTFGPTTSADVPNSPFGLDVGDLDHDGNLDLVVASWGGKLSVLLGDGTGSFGPRTDSDVGIFGYPALAVALGDLNRDGNLDAVVSVQGGPTDVPPVDASLRVLLGTGTGTFGPQSAPYVLPGALPFAVELADMNGDAALDAVASVRDDGSVTVRLGTGTGGFLARVDYPSAKDPYFFAIADVNGDHRPDVLVPNAGAETVTLLLGQAPAP